MTDRRDLGPTESTERYGAAGDDRVVDAERRAAAAEQRADMTERRHEDDRRDLDRHDVVRKPTYGFGSLVALLAALAIALSTFLAWNGDDAFDESSSGADFSIQSLWDTAAASGQPSLLFILLPAAILVLIGTFIPRARLLAIIGGAAALATAVLFFISISRRISDSEYDGAAFEVIGVGTWLAGIGGLVAIIGALMIPRRDVAVR
ncbi:MAG: hypothetical protein ACR2HP_02560 [Ilumatobacteraceae bacterium]